MSFLRCRKLVFFCGFAFLVGAVPLVAQELTGAIEGAAKDSSGAVLPGVTVEASSSGIGTVVATSDARGNYRFPRVPTGVYSVRATLMGYKPAGASNVNVTLGKTATVNLTMEPGVVTEEITVTAEAPMVDITRSATATSIAREQIEFIPKGRDFTSVVTQAAGASREPFLQGLSIDGASGAENRFILDGLDTTHPYNGVSGQQFSTTPNSGIGGQGIVTDFVEEIQVKSAGYAAEFGGSVGGVVNVITKSGSNDISGSLLGYYTDSSWEGKVRPTFYESDPTLYRTFRKDDETRFEPGGMVGGPIMRDQMWFFAGYNPTLASVTRTPDGSTTDYDQDTTIDYFTANLKGNVGSKLLFKLGLSYTNNEVEGVLPAQDGTTPATANLNITTKTPVSSYSLYGDYIPTSNFYLSARAGYYNWDTKTAGVNATNRMVFTGSNAQFLPAGDPLIRPGGFQSIPNASIQEVAFDQWERQAGGIDGNLFVTGLGHHAFKAGVQVEEIKNEVSSGEFGNLITFRWNLPDPRSLGVRGTYGSVGVRRFRTQGGSDSNNLGIYIQDSWTVIPTLTLNLGVRTEKEYVPYYGHRVDPSLPEWLTSWDFEDKIAPRLGFAWDAMSNHRLKVYGSYGTYYDIMKIDMSRQSGGAARWIDYWYPLETTDWTTIPGQCQISTNDQSFNPCPSLGPNRSIDLRLPTDPSEGVDPNLKPMEQREYQLGAEFQLTPQSVVAVRYVNKKLINAIEDVGVTIVLPNGNLAELFFTANPGKGIVAGGVEGCPQCAHQPTAKRDYEAVTLSYNRAFRDNWSVRGNYTWSELIGNYSGLASSDEFGRNDPNIERAFDHLHNAFDQNGRETVGPLNTDRPHRVGAQVLYRAPWGSQLGLNTHWMSGTPISEEVTFVGVPFFPHGRKNHGRYDDLSATDLLLSHSFQFGGYFLEASINVLNLFDEDTVTRVGTNHYRVDLCTHGQSTGRLPCTPQKAAAVFFEKAFDTDAIMAGATVQPNYLKAISFQAPRSIRLGVKLTF